MYRHGASGQAKTNEASTLCLIARQSVLSCNVWPNRGYFWIIGTYPFVCRKTYTWQDWKPL